MTLRDDEDRRVRLALTTVFRIPQTYDTHICVSPEGGKVLVLSSPARSMTAGRDPAAGVTYWAAHQSDQNFDLKPSAT